MIPDPIITAWGNQAPWKDRVQVEQDLVLHGVILAIFSDKQLCEHLAFRGGTCLNKLFWTTPVRYSEDIDLVQIKDERIGSTITQLRRVLESIFTEKPKYESKSGRSFRLFYSYAPEANPNRIQRVKIEINTEEHFSIDGYQQKPIVLDSEWRRGEAKVTTFSIEELLATKIRALFQRRKGRDLFDLWMSRELKPNYKKAVEIYQQYARRRGKPIHRDLMISNLQEKLQDPGFNQDVIPLIRPDIKYDVSDAARFVSETIYSQIPISKTRLKKQNQNR